MRSLPALSRRAGALLIAGALSAPLAAAVVGAAPAQAADTDVVISEVESSDPDGGEDWVELQNTGTEPVDVSGWYLKDDNDDRTWQIPAGTVIEPGAFLVLDHEKAVPGGFDFGLGGEDAARLFAADGTTLIDEITWTEHAPTTYIRIDGEVVASAEPTKGAENSGPYEAPKAPGDHPDAGTIRVTEAVSEGDDWVEIMNVSDREVDLSGWYLLDEKDLPNETPHVLPAGTTLAPGEILQITGMPFGLGKGDQARLFTDNGYLMDGLAWPEGTHAAPSWQLCGPEGTAGMSHVATPGAPNACGDVVITETNSKGDDFVELTNLGEQPADLSGHRILDDDDEHVFTIPEGTVLQPGEILLITGDELGFGLGGEDMVRLQDPSGELLGQVAWSEHVLPSNALCDGVYGPSGAATPGAQNDCGPGEGDPETTPLPTDGNVIAADDPSEWGEDLSGLDLQILEDGTQVLWAVNNDAGQISRLERDGEGIWRQSEGWPTGGKLTRFADGTGTPDGEGISVGTDGLIYVSAERDNDTKGTSRNTILAFDASSSEQELVAVSEWNLTEVLPTTSANGGLEGIEMVGPEAMANLGVEVPAAQAYAFVVLEDTGDVYALALQADGSAELLATLPSPLDGLMALDYDAASNTLWAFGDEAVQGMSVQYNLGAKTVEAGPVLERAEGMPEQFANEGVALEPTDVCTEGVRMAWFADDADTDGTNLRGIGLLDERCDAGSAPEEEQPGEEKPDDETPGEEDAADEDSADDESGAVIEVGTGGSAPSGTSPSGSTATGARPLARTGLEAGALAAAAAGLGLLGTWLVRRSRRA